MPDERSSDRSALCRGGTYIPILTADESVFGGAKETQNFRAPVLFRPSEPVLAVHEQLMLQTAQGSADIQMGVLYAHRRNQ